MATPTVRYDADANAASIRCSPTPVTDSEEVSEGIVFDFDAEGRLVGIEVMDASRHLSPDRLGQAA
ncbi:DUF2283 domain-containing protein [Jiella sp. MQZ9-1]|uniref:DUF2283 domain-containing protein n=1 Tax=Jiella flava TaxID=2816857 RepID=A0A939JWZ1_9HYPH|nr:DUF2283 domain-containing protein [Jiella flava]MBO0664039.1 DUF2283 domain-containing protein [Jiella flava]MCD2472611.1 DUF2283 domain-containing protein [Jiella flava]